MENNSYESEFMCSSNSYFPPPHAGAQAGRLIGAGIPRQQHY